MVLLKNLINSMSYNYNKFGILGLSFYNKFNKKL